MLMPDFTLTSSLASILTAAVGGLIGGFVTLRVARNQYRNDFYKNVVSRRIAAYEQLEYLITMLKTSVVDEDDPRPYHILFKSNDSSEMFKSSFVLSSHAMWLSNKVNSEVISLNRILYTFPIDKAGIIEQAKVNYRTIADTRTRLEKLYARDFLKLHDVPSFLRSKKPEESYGPLPEVKGSDSP